MTAHGATGHNIATGVNDNDVLFTTGDMEPYDSFMLQTTAGAVDVYANLLSTDPADTHWTTAALSLEDMGATTSSPVLVTVAGRMYRFRGKFKALKVLQNGDTAATAILKFCVA